MVCAALEDGRLDDVPAARRQRAETCGEAEKCIGHVERNRRRMRYPEFRKMGGDLTVEAVNADLEKDLRYYNDERPHAGIGMMTPNERYAASSELPEESEMS